MALKIVLLALLVYCASEAQSQEVDTSLPLSYNAIEIQGDGATCPNEQFRQETRENVTVDIQSHLQETVFPSLLLSQGWIRVAYLDMTDPNQQCPSGWQLYTTPRRTCGRNSNAESCRSVLYQTYGVSYTRVCGRIVAYQYCQPYAFNRYNAYPTRTIDDVYLDGISITHGNPREHVWTFAAAYDESINGNSITCPCTNTNNNDNANILIPPFVGEDYFCDSGAVSYSCTFYDEDPLWDGAGCGPTSTCCELNNAPWFCKTLPVSQPVTDDIELRICGRTGSTVTDVPVELIELYVS